MVNMSPNAVLLVGAVARATHLKRRQLLPVCLGLLRLCGSTASFLVGSFAQRRIILRVPWVRNPEGAANES